MWVHLLIGDKYIQISGNLLCQDMVSQELQPMFWDNFESKKSNTHHGSFCSGHYCAPKKQIAYTNLPNFPKLLSNLASSLGQTAEQFGETADKTAEQFGSNC